jgi:hypothetical protein
MPVAENNPRAAQPESTAVKAVSHSPLRLVLTSLTDQSKTGVWVCRKPVRSGAKPEASDLQPELPLSAGAAIRYGKDPP